MQVFGINARTGGAAGVAASLGGVVAAIGRPAFGAHALAALNSLLRVGSWSVYRLWPDRPPVMYASASHGVADTTQQCFDTYRDTGLFRRDRSFDLVGRHAAGDAVLLRMHADEVPDAAHRDAIYRRHAMVERLSLAWRLDDRSLLAVNLYHHAHQGAFESGEVDRVVEVAPLLQAAAARHVDLLAAPEPAVPPAPVDVVAARCPALTARERQVLDLLLAGLTYDGVAAALGVSVGTVKTYRARAFGRLGIHFRSQLFALARPGGRAR